jgi:hypothetical protein
MQRPEQQSRAELAKQNPWMVAAALGVEAIRKELDKAGRAVDEAKR